MNLEVMWPKSANVIDYDVASLVFHGALKYDDKDFSEDIHPSMRDFFIDFSETTGKGDYGYTTWTFYPAEAGSHVWKEMEVVWAGDISVMEYLEEQQKLWDKARSKNALIPVGKR